ncbi:MFS transporter [Paraburkholderia sp. Ac-20336]|uniref:MFS transporter n=1 Tax=Burkholderiaceae TaxID=119060 RepID=UPI00141F1076|nr:MULTISPECIES: MFS transporter [Burkholderiaceae]MBN3801597.1 MFS transporter [Paraburkholderia sp. Ac-20336]MBN3846568.1 MFS transporter [Paraburkholderia sp. Ac-20342]NIF55654.1 MFS transporter [Burkholderia sp. Ax-1724]NIF77976.1 MFS transporter [Paraburkholderia sp. Cy-641]
MSAASNEAGIASAGTASGSGAAPMSRAMVRRAIFASVLGNGLEWFDFLIYGYFSKIIAQVFFPTGTGYLSLMLTFATFAIGFCVRPLGGILLGMYADRVGRSRALSLLIISMASSTLLMGLTPGYARIGLAAPALVVLARVLQGLSVGGQFATASAMLVEYAPPGRKMFYGSFNMSAQAFALLLSSGAGYLLTSWLSHEQLVAWGWRVPFLCGVLAGPIGFYIRHHVAESPEFQQLRENGAPPPRVSLRQFFRNNGRAAICAMGVIAVGAATNYVWHSYLAVYVERQLHLPLAVALRGAFLSGVLNLFLFPLSGRLADRYGPYRLFYPVTIAWMLCAWPLFAFVVSAPSAERLLFAQIVSTVFLAAMSGAHPGMLAMLFPVRSRSSGVALSYNVAVTLFGGLAPLTVTWLTRLTGSSLTPAFYLIFAGFVSLALVYGARRGPYGARLGEPDSLTASAAKRSPPA